MRISLPTQLVRSSLGSHSWLGLLTGGLMYLVCLSGTLVIFYEELERWEQPVAEEYRDMDPALIEAAFNDYMASGTEITEHMYVVFPSAAIPRIKLSSDTEGLYLNRDGSPGPPAYTGLSDLLTGLHINLHLPVTVGIVVVAALGALLCGLIITGFLAHPSIVRDAFRLRLAGNRRLGQVDLHNRLGVWGAPFHLMIAVTGAYYGFVVLLMGMFAQSIDGTSSQAVYEEVFPAEPRLENQAPNYSVARALEQVRELSPDGRLLYLIVHDAASDNRFMEFYVQQPGMLAWSENYRFDTAGNYLGSAGYTDSEPERRLHYSVYRIHFGHFGGLVTKFLYLVLGLALTVVSVSGINIWLEKRKYRDQLNLIWPGLVWGAPLIIVIAAITQVIFHLPSIAIFWGGLIITMSVGLLLEDERATRQIMQGMTGIGLLALQLAYGIKFSDHAFTPAAMTINLPLLGIALLFLYGAYRQRRAVVVTRVVME